VRYLERFKKFLRLMKESEIAGALIAPSTNLYYLTGINPLRVLERLFILIALVNDDPILIAPKLYENELKESWVKNVILWKDEEDPYIKFKKIMLEKFREGEKLLIDDTIPASIILKGHNVLDKYNLNPLNPVISRLRAIKDDEEIENLKKASEIVDKVFYEILNREMKGKSEREIAMSIEYAIKEFGADISFEPIVASGPNSANPHHKSSNRKIREGDIIILDYGAKYNEYCSDITRTIVIGNPSEEIKKVYKIVNEAQEKAFQTVKEGIMAKEIDFMARETIRNYGYGEYFIHRTGHGLGLDVHEEPYITPNSEIILKEKMIFTIEPGIYLPNKFGIRIEDDIIIINNKGNKLTQASRELFIV